MNMDDLLLVQLLGANANALPYQITEAAQETKILASFEHLTEQDALEIQSVLWVGARFRDVWLAWLDEEHTFKLVIDSDVKKRIQGIVRLGEVNRAEFVGLSLRGSLLETAPINRQQSLERMYSGIGNALIARMIVESLRQGAKGQLLVRPVDDSLPFYRHLGFHQVRYTPYYVLSAANAQAWLIRYFGLP